MLIQRRLAVVLPRPQAVHIQLFSMLFILGALFATITLHFSSGMELPTAVSMVWRRVSKSMAFRQLVVISFAIVSVSGPQLVPCDVSVTVGHTSNIGFWS